MISELKLATLDEVAATLQVSKNTIKAWPGSRGFPQPVACPRNGSPMYSVAAIQKWMDKVSFEHLEKVKQKGEIPAEFAPYL